jgi:hypothetical protein
MATAQYVLMTVTRATQALNRGKALLCPYGPNIC